MRNPLEECRIDPYYWQEWADDFKEMGLELTIENIEKYQKPIIDALSRCNKGKNNHKMNPNYNEAMEEWLKVAREQYNIFFMETFPDLSPLLLTRYTLDLMDETKFLSEKLWNKSLENE